MNPTKTIQSVLNVIIVFIILINIIIIVKS